MSLLRSLFKKSNPLSIFESHTSCVLHVRRHDYENYLAALCIKDHKCRRAMFALRAFNVELALIKDKTTDSDRAKMRFQFWSGLVDEIVRRNDDFENPDNDRTKAYYKHSPVAKEMIELFHLIDVNLEVRSYMRDLIGSRLSSKILGYKKFDTISELELYCSKSNSSLYQLALIMSRQLHNVWQSNLDQVEVARSIAQDLGVAHGLSNVLRAIPYNYEKNTCHIPQDLLKSHGLSSRDFIANVKRPQLDSARVRPVIEELASRCKTLLKVVHRDHRYIPSYFRQLYLSRVGIENYLKKLEKNNYNVCDPRVMKRSELLPFNLWLKTRYFRAPLIG